jgi:general secretion pathway protein I
MKPLQARGFTLLEVMIALAIVSVALVALLGLGNRTLGVHDRLERLTRATLLAQRKMTEVEAAARQPAAGPQATAGEFAPPDDGYRWRLAYEETPYAAVQKLTLTDAWGDEGRNERVELDSFLRR